MIRLHRRLVLSILTAFCLIFGFCLPSALGGPTVIMTGIVPMGTLNGQSIDGEDFTVTAAIASPLDLESATHAGIFGLSSATMQIGMSLQFDFDPTSTYFAQAVGSEFQVAFIDGATLATFDDNFGYSASSNLPTIDPNVIQPYSYSSFTGDLGFGGATFTNGSGDTLTFNGTASFEDLSTASITVVPEPTTLATALFTALALLIPPRRRR